MFVNEQSANREIRNAACINHTDMAYYVNKQDSSCECIVYTRIWTCFVSKQTHHLAQLKINRNRITLTEIHQWHVSANESDDDKHNSIARSQVTFNDLALK